MTYVQHALEGHGIRLEPLTTDHLADLRAASEDGRLSELFFTSVPSPETMAVRVDGCLERAAAGEMLPFVVRVGEGPVVGMTTLCHIDWPNRRGEIGFTWYAASHQGTGLNVRAKRLMLGLVFDELDLVAVEFRTHWLNHRSRRAIERLGAKQDGVLRNHTIMADGTLRDTVVFSIIASEWPAVRSLLDHRIATELREGGR